MSSLRISPLWHVPDPREARPLPADAQCDVCVIGAGIAGLTTAYLLAQEGKQVILLEAKPHAVEGESLFTTAHLAWVIDDRFARVEATRGADVAKDAAASHRSAVDLIEQIVTRETIDCQFARVDGYLFAGKDGRETLEAERRVLRSLHLPFEWIDRVPFPARAPGPALRFPAQGQFHPVKYLRAIEHRLEALGARIHTDSTATGIRGGARCEVEVKGGRRVAASAVVVATNNPFAAGVAMHLKVAAYLTYVIAAEVPRGTLPLALFWDTEDPYHYVRIQPGVNGDTSDYLIVGGEDHRTGQETDMGERWDRLETWARQYFPLMGVVRHRWSGEIFETPDGLGLIGLAPGSGDNVYIITGDSGMGLTHGTLGARLVADLVMGRSNPYAAAYSPSRWMPGAARTLLQESLNSAVQYTDWLTGGDVKSVDEIPKGQGAVVRSGLTKLAVYKNQDGLATRLSAVCPHMGCIVRWNPGEQTWDCPCHGSRFAADGAVMHGPAISNLRPAE